ncbi:MAG: hypothetical protein ACJAVK_001727 [Akkermansiaceae bacterium]|jgi:hypothetical protein
MPIESLETREWLGVGFAFPASLGAGDIGEERPEMVVNNPGVEEPRWSFFEPHPRSDFAKIEIRY